MKAQNNLSAKKPSQCENEVMRKLSLLHFKVTNVLGKSFIFYKKETLR